MLTKGFSSCTQTRFLFKNMYTVDMKIINWISETPTQLGDVTTDTGVGLVDSVTCTCPPSPVSKKERLLKESVYKNKKKSMLCLLWRMRNLSSSCSADKVKWGLRRWSSEQKWSLLRAPPPCPSAGRSISRDIASKGSTDPNIRTPSGCRPMEDFVQGLHWRNQI